MWLPFACDAASTDPARLFLAQYYNGPEDQPEEAVEFRLLGVSLPAPRALFMHRYVSNVPLTYISPLFDVPIKTFCGAVLLPSLPYNTAQARRVPRGLTRTFFGLSPLLRVGSDCGVRFSGDSTASAVNFTTLNLRPHVESNEELFLLRCAFLPCWYWFDQDA